MNDRLAFPKPHVACALSLLLIAAFAVAGCSRDGSSKASAMVVDTIGDTIVVRSQGPGEWGDSLTLAEDLRIGALDGQDEYTFGQINSIAVAADGSIYVLDGQANTVRHFDAAGEYLGAIGRKGAGPGELGEYASGMAFLPDGRLLVRDFRNARINLYSPDGQSIGQWAIPEGFSTSDPLEVDSAGNAYTQVITSRADNGSFTVGVMRIGPDGQPADTLKEPYPDFKPISLVATRVVGTSRSMSASSAPFTPSAFWTLDRAGRVVGGINTRYAIETFLPDGRIRRIERPFEPVAVASGERSAAEEMITRNMRRLDPNWRWNAPRTPDTKPPFRDLRVAEDGRLWVKVSRPGFKLPADTSARPDPGALPPLDRWSEPAAYDVFEPDGRFLGTVHFPRKLEPLVMRGDYVWGEWRDEDDVPFVVRYRVQR